MHTFCLENLQQHFHSLFEKSQIGKDNDNRPSTAMNFEISVDIESVYRQILVGLSRLKFHAFTKIFINIHSIFSQNSPGNPNLLNNQGSMGRFRHLDKISGIFLMSNEPYSGRAIRWSAERKLSSGK